MKRLKGESTPRHIKAIHYSVLTGIHVGIGRATSTHTNPGFWPMVMETFSERKLKKGEADRAERRVCNDTGWTKIPAS